MNTRESRPAADRRRPGSVARDRQRRCRRMSWPAVAGSCPSAGRSRAPPPPDAAFAALRSVGTPQARLDLLQHGAGRTSSVPVDDERVGPRRGGQRKPRRHRDHCDCQRPAHSEATLTAGRRSRASARRPGSRGRARRRRTPIAPPAISTSRCRAPRRSARRAGSRAAAARASPSSRRRTRATARAAGSAARARCCHQIVEQRETDAGEHEHHGEQRARQRRPRTARSAGGQPRLSTQRRRAAAAAAASGSRSARRRSCPRRARRRACRRRARSP